MELWFTKKHTENVRFSVQVDKQLYSLQSDFQRIDIFSSREFGRFLTLDRLVFGDMAIYFMVKNNTFNGMPFPDIIALKQNGSWETVKHFGYEDFKNRV